MKIFAMAMLAAAVALCAPRAMAADERVDENKESRATQGVRDPAPVGDDEDNKVQSGFDQETHDFIHDPRRDGRYSVHSSKDINSRSNQGKGIARHLWYDNRRGPNTTESENAQRQGTN